MGGLGGKDGGLAPELRVRLWGGGVVGVGGMWGVGVKC